MSTKKAGIALGGMIVAVIAAIALLGGDDTVDSTSDTDGAFVAEMIPHHQMAIEMAQVAQDRAQHPEIKSLADDIVAAQSTEIDQLSSIHERLYGGPVDETEHPSMGLSSEAMGMSMEDVSSLETARPFDRAFIDMMIPHHQGAITMARVELADGTDVEAQSLADEIIAAQSREIKAMNEWRTKWYGTPSPAGGVPDPSDVPTSSSAADEMSGMEH